MGVEKYTGGDLISTGAVVDTQARANSDCCLLSAKYDFGKCRNTQIYSSVYA
jgi:hypothetical protein